MNLDRKKTLRIAELSVSKTKRENSKAAEMLVTVMNNIETWDLPKLNRWIGYAQCLLVAEGATSIDELRDDIRALGGDEEDTI